MENSFIQMFSKNKHQFLILFAAVFAIFSMISGVFVGAVNVTVPDILNIITGKMFHLQLYQGEKSTEMIIWEIRFSRVLLAFFVGASLSLAGAAFQGLLQNPLADPYTIGVSSGASLGAVIIIFFQIQVTILGSFTLPIIAVLFGMITLLIVFALTHLASGKLTNETIILAGIIISSFISAFISLLIALIPREDISQILYWIMGSVAMRGWGHVQLIVPFFVLGAAIILFHYRELNNMALGEQAAQFSGMNVKKKKTIVLIAASILTGSAVAVSGAIGFVGLVIPHLVRLMAGSNHRYVLPLSVLIGGGYLVLADLLARSIISPKELPIGVVTALIGSPIFTLLLVKNRKQKKAQL
ncbi:FecCD family ABC transporter permease [Metabacillus dongyingensis]|uniref:FecCD family ABC transporter permease n=1 Tax=Metabacillus dongyingensis TaxID=2874282 RepID=UPI003B839C49